VIIIDHLLTYRKRLNSDSSIQMCVVPTALGPYRGCSVTCAKHADCLNCCGRSVRSRHWFKFPCCHSQLPEISVPISPWIRLSCPSWRFGCMAELPTEDSREMLSQELVRNVPCGHRGSAVSCFLVVLRFINARVQTDVEGCLVV
jgi:hypothetical protein